MGGRDHERGAAGIFCVNTETCTHNKQAGKDRRGVSGTGWVLTESKKILGTLIKEGGQAHLDKEQGPRSRRGTSVALLF